MEFGLIVILGLAALVGMLLLIGKYYPGSGADVLDWKPTRSYEDEVRLELEDIDQMLEAQNERRRSSGRAEISEDDVRAEVQADDAALRERAARYEAERERPER
ncbi:MAG: hypothetical protein WD844_04750 [Thermoleophilaceae bacterium]